LGSDATRVDDLTRNSPEMLQEGTSVL
jgi:hypothetical protein